MKYKYLILLLTMCSMLTVSCGDDDEDGTGNGGSVPEGALPSSEFNLNNLSEEPYAESARKYIVQQSGVMPFGSVEFMADGHYLILSDDKLLAKSGKVSVGLAGKKVTVLKSGAGLSFKAATTRGTDNETVTFGNGCEYGTYTKQGENKYVLSNGTSMEILEETGSNATISYIDRNGRTSTVYVNTETKTVDSATKSLCRSWNINSLEFWGYINNAYCVHGKQTIKDGKAETLFELSPSIDSDEFEEDDFLDGDDEAPYKVKFTRFGTYIVSYLNGEMELAAWSWVDASQGIFHYEDYYDSEYDYDYDYDWTGECTVRFAGKQMRIYEDYSEYEAGQRIRTVVVNTLTAHY